MLKGWTNGMASVDPSLNAGGLRLAVRVSQLQPRHAVDAGLRRRRLRQRRSDPIGGATGSNIRGYISFAAACTPTSTLAAEEATLLNPPWSGQFNTLQFNAGVYCAPAAP